ncbi:MAG TPA: hypothetical protein VJA47_01365 [archaeon]|nr:hypothetical protein [archaeon]
MRNPISASCKFFDDAVMYGVNKAVYAWNWTTGYTKEDLSNALNLVGYPLLCSSVFYKYPLASVAATSFGVLAALATRSMNLDYGDRERQAIDKGMLDPKVEMHKKNCKANGYVLTFGDMFLAICRTNGPNSQEYCAVWLNQ